VVRLLCPQDLQGFVSGHERTGRPEGWSEERSAMALGGRVDAFSAVRYLIPRVWQLRWPVRTRSDRPAGVVILCSASPTGDGCLGTSQGSGRPPYPRRGTPIGHSREAPGGTGDHSERVVGPSARSDLRLMAVVPLAWSSQSLPGLCWRTEIRMLQPRPTGLWWRSLIEPDTVPSGRGETAWTLPRVYVCPSRRLTPRAAGGSESPRRQDGTRPGGRRGKNGI